MPCALGLKEVCINAHSAYTLSVSGLWDVLTQLGWEAFAHAIGIMFYARIIMCNFVPAPIPCVQQAHIQTEAEACQGQQAAHCVPILPGQCSHAGGHI